MTVFKSALQLLMSIWVLCGVESFQYGMGVHSYARNRHHRQQQCSVQLPKTAQQHQTQVDDTILYSNSEDISTANLVDEVTSRLSTLANICTKNILQKTISFQSLDWFYDLASDMITNLTVSGVPVVRGGGQTLAVNCLVLPPELPWPSFGHTKQSDALGRHIVVQKSAPLTMNWDQVRIVDRLLRMKKKVAMIGHPGVGKSTEVNLLFPALFQSLKQGTDIDAVYLRMNLDLFKFFVRNNSIECSLVENAGHSLLSLALFFNAATDWRRAMLVLEMQEEEKDPLFNIPSVVSLQSENVQSVLKTWDKSDSLGYSDRPPHSPEELLVLATAQFQCNREALLESLVLSPNTTDPVRVHKEIVKRIRTVGPLARQVLGTQKQYDIWVDHKRANRKRGNLQGTIYE